MNRTLLAVALGAAAFYVVANKLGEGRPGIIAFDVYGYFYPNILHALRSIAAGGRGLLWNPFQNCGQPFLGISETGLLYPLNLLFLVFSPQRALRGVLFGNLVIGGFGAYGLGRAIGLKPVGALSGALAFVLSNAMYAVTTWMPTVQAPYAFMPAAMMYCERMARQPSVRDAVLLGVVLALSLLPGHPQFVLFTCQLIGLRVLWSLTDRSERRHVLPLVGAVGLALIVALLTAAVQVLPSLQVAAESVRHLSLGLRDIAPRGSDTLASVVRLIRQHSTAAPFLIVPGFVALAAIAAPPQRRSALFYLLAGALFFVLAFGDKTPLGRIYYDLPLSSFFRMPGRFLLVAGFCVSVLTGIAIDVLAAGSWRGLSAAAAAFAALMLWIGYWRIDLELAAALFACGALALALPKARPIVAAAMVGVIALSGVLNPPYSLARFLADDGPLLAHAQVFEWVRAHATPQDRVVLARAGAQDDTGFQQKTAMLFGLRSITDYETQGTERYAEYVTMLRLQELVRNLNQIYFPGPWKSPLIRWPLVNLAAGRYVIADRDVDKRPLVFPLSPVPVVEQDNLQVYENPRALPRAYYVPRIAVEADAAARLRRLANAPEDRRRLALVNEPPPSGFLGERGNSAVADAHFVVDDPERVVLETVAPARGFLFLADQYFPDWTATVNGQPAPIMVANHAFRLVEVPAGPVTVEFRYRPVRVWIGAAISALTTLAIAAFLFNGWRRKNAAAVAGKGSAADEHRLRGAG